MAAVANRVVLLPRPVLREQAGVRVIWNVESRPTVEITLTLALPRGTGRGDQRESGGREYAVHAEGG